MTSGAAPEILRTAVELQESGKRLLTRLESMFDGVTGRDDESTHQELPGGGRVARLGKPDAPAPRHLSDQAALAE